VSGRKGNGRIDKFLARASESAGCRKGEVLPFAPDFFDSLIRRMATPGDFVERTFAWLLYRASGNQKIHAIHIYCKAGNAATETPLRQGDCALELAWLGAGHRAEWLDAPIDQFREEAIRRGVEPISRNLISRGFIANRNRGTLAPDTGHLLVLVPSPDPRNFPHSQETHRKKGKSPEHQRFMAWAAVTYSQEFHELEVARSRVERLNTLLLSRYKEWKKSCAPEQNAGTSLEALETLETLETLEALEAWPSSSTLSIREGHLKPVELQNSTTTTKPSLPAQPSSPSPAKPKVGGVYCTCQMGRDLERAEKRSEQQRSMAAAADETVNGAAT